MSSKERQRARAVREATRAAEVAAAAKLRQRQVRRQVLLKRVKPVRPKRQRRYGALPAWARFQLACGFVALQGVAWFLFDGVGQRFSVAVLTLAVMLVLVRTRKGPAR